MIIRNLVGKSSNIAEGRIIATPVDPTPTSGSLGWEVPGAQRIFVITGGEVQAAPIVAPCRYRFQLYDGDALVDTFLSGVPDTASTPITIGEIYAAKQSPVSIDTIYLQQGAPIEGLTASGGTSTQVLGQDNSHNLSWTSVTDPIIGARTADPSAIPAGNVGTLTQWISYLTNRIKAILGISAASWYSTPPATLSDVATHVAANAPHPGHEVVSMKGGANGYAPLDSGAKISTLYLPDAALGALRYQGTWNAATNAPTLTSSSGSKGHYYKVSVAGATPLDGISDWQTSDWAVFNGLTWDKVDNSDLVISVAGKLGAVTLYVADILDAGTGARRNVPVTGDAAAGELMLGSDSRNSNARTPTAHKSTHATGGGDAITPSDIGASAVGQGHDASAIQTGIISTDRLGSGIANVSAYLRGNSTWYQGSMWKMAIVLEAPGLVTGGGTFTSGAWRIRNLTTIRTGAQIAISLLSNAIVFPAGTYVMIAICPAFRVDRNQTRIRNSTPNTVLAEGGSVFAGSVGDYATSLSVVMTGFFTTADNDQIVIEHKCQTTRANTGFGDNGASQPTAGTSDVYTQAIIWKVE